MPDVYTHGHHDSVLRSHRWRTAENSAPHLLPHLRPGQRLLDVGCGPGTITADLARRVAPGEVLGLDAAEEVLAEARQQPDLPGTVRFAVGDGYALDHPDDSFDVVHAHQVLQHLSDPVAALREMRRVCRPGGVVAVRDADYATFTWAPGDDRLDAWLATYHAVARANDAEPDAGRHLLGWAHAAGFTEVNGSASAWCYSTPDERAWWGALWADRLRHSDLAHQAVAGGHATRGELDAMAAGFEAWQAHPDGWFALLHGEVVAHP